MRSEFLPKSPNSSHKELVMSNRSSMIDRLVRSALQTGCLSVESEGLIRQLLNTQLQSEVDLKALQLLHSAMQQGRVQREAPASVAPPGL